MGVRANSFSTQVVQYHQGKITLAEFFKATEDSLHRVASKLMLKWRTPPAVGLEDVVQELRIGCAQAFKRYDSSRGEVGPYVMFTACDKAKKWVHRQRGANLHGNADSNPSRYFELFVDAGDWQDGGSNGRLGRLVQRAASELPSQEEACEHHEVWRRIFKQAPTHKLRLGLLALSHVRGERKAAAKMLYGNLQARLRLRLGSMHEADRVIVKAIEYLEEQVAA